MIPYETDAALARLQAMTSTNPDASLDWLTIRVALSEAKRLDTLVSQQDREHVHYLGGSGHSNSAPTP